MVEHCFDTADTVVRFHSWVPSLKSHLGMNERWGRGYAPVSDAASEGNALEVCEVVNPSPKAGAEGGNPQILLTSKIQLGVGRSGRDNGL